MWTGELWIIVGLVAAVALVGVMLFRDRGVPPPAPRQMPGASRPGPYAPPASRPLHPVAVVAITVVAVVVGIGMLVVGAAVLQMVLASQQ